MLEKSGETGIEEGRLSIPRNSALVPRAEKVKIRALDRDGNPFELEADGLLAIWCIQHEMDHLVGKPFIDYLSPLLKQQRIRQKSRKTRPPGTPGLKRQEPTCQIHYVLLCGYTLTLQRVIRRVVPTSDM